MEKFGEYCHAGISEYWIVDPEEQSVEIYTLIEDSYRLLGRFRRGQVIPSRVLDGFEMSVDEVFTE
jgi:Uma2 family endonuclease